MARKRQNAATETPVLGVTAEQGAGAAEPEPIKLKTKQKDDILSPSEPVTKDDYQGWRGGLKIDLKRTRKNGKTNRDDLSAHLKDVLDREIANQAGRVEKFRKWANQYDGKRPDKDFPWPNCANVAVPVTRYSTDNWLVRLWDHIFNKRKVFVLRPRPAYVGNKQEYVERIREMEDALDWFNKNVLKIKEKLLSPFLECAKLGAGCYKLVFERKTKTVYQYAGKAELDDDSITKYTLAGTKTKGVKKVITEYEGPNIYPVPREDVVFSSDAATVSAAYLVGFRTYQRRAEINKKVIQGLYDEDAAAKIKTPDKHDENKENRAEAKETEIKQTPHTEPYEIWELWLKYDVDEDGDEDDIVVSFHRETAQILSAIYNPLFYGFKPLGTLRCFPREYSIDGYGIPETLEKSQEEVDTMHNQRIDRLSIINCPPVLVRAGTDMEKLTNLSPAKIIPIDDELENNIREFKLSDVYPSTFQEENMLKSDMRDAVGITPIAMGVSTAERPVGRDTLIQQEETNKKFLFGTNLIRQDLTELGRMELEIFAQYMPEFHYVANGENGPEDRIVFFDADLIRNGLDVDLEASTEMWNQETRREVRLTLYQLMSDYMTKTASMLQALVNPQIPSDFKKAIVKGLQVGETILTRILQDFDEKDPESMLFSPLSVIDVEANIMRSVDLQPSQPPPGQPGGEGGQPGPGGQGPGPGGGGLAQGPPPQEQPQGPPPEMMTGQ